MLACSVATDGMKARTASAVLGVIIVAAFSIHLLGPVYRPFWMDEASTYWTIRQPLPSLLAGARTDGSPPLYFLVAWLASRVGGTSEFALRWPSVTAATLLVPVVFAATRMVSTARAAVAAAGLAAVSPLVNYYAIEARGYAVVQLLAAVALLALLYALREPTRLTRWAALGTALAALLLTHNYGLFLLPAPVLAALAAGGRDRVRVAMRATGTVAAAFVLYLPWFRLALSNDAAGVSDWIASWWHTMPPTAAIVRSIQLFAGGSRYPTYLSYLAQAPSSRVLGILALLVPSALIAVASVQWGEAPQTPNTRRARAALLASMMVPLVVALVYSFLREPIYVAGRYDTIALPPFLVLLAIGVDKLLAWRTIAGWAGLAAAGGLAAISLSPSFGPLQGVDQTETQAVEYLRAAARPDDQIICLGLRRPVVQYYLERAGWTPNLTSFPAEEERHPGWYSDRRLLANPTALAREGRSLAAAIATLLRAGRHVWLLGSGHVDVDNYLYDPLFVDSTLDPMRSRPELAVFCLKTR